MINPYNYEDCAALVTAASSTLEQSAEEIKQLFRNNEMYEISHSYDKVKQYSLEIQFERGGLICLLGLNERCEKAFLMPEKVPEIAVFIEYCNRNFSYHELLNGWVANNRLIRLYSKNDECGLIIYSLYSQGLEISV